MALFRAYVDNGRFPHERSCEELEASSFRKLKSELQAKGFAWPELELPRSLLPGHYFTAEKDGTRLEIYKVRA